MVNSRKTGREQIERNRKRPARRLPALHHFYTWEHSAGRPILTTPQVFPPTAVVHANIFAHRRVRFASALSAALNRPAAKSLWDKAHARKILRFFARANFQFKCNRCGFFPSARERIFSVHLSLSFLIPSARLECLLGYNACSSKEIRSAPTLCCCR